jgi:hypothetical protein
MAVATRSLFRSPLRATRECFHWQCAIVPSCLPRRICEHCLQIAIQRGQAIEPRAQPCPVPVWVHGADDQLQLSVARLSCVGWLLDREGPTAIV